MMAAGKKTAVSRIEARLYLSKAEQFIEQARVAFDAERYDAAQLDAIHAAISGADAVTVALVGRRSTDPDHQRAADLLEEAAASSPEVRERSRQLRALLARKNAVEYESRRASAKEGRDAVERAGRLVDWARRIVDRARV
jgi:HEPN domain-containing protein